MARRGSEPAKPATIDDVADLLSARSTVSRADTHAVLVELGNVLGELMASSRSVKLKAVGSFYLNLRTAIPTGTTATLPINISSNGVSLPLMETEGTPVTVANITGAGIYEIHYNRYTNELYLVNGGYRPTEAAAAATATPTQGAATADFNDFNK